MGAGIWDERLAPRLIGYCCGRSFINERRREVVPLARGRVLELGVGAGGNFGFYEAGRVESVVGVEPSAVMRALAVERGRAVGLKVEVMDGVGERLPWEAGGFDTVVTTYTLCSVAVPERVLAEARRVLKPDGRLLFLEHGRSPDARVRVWQRRLEPLWKRALGNCHLTRPVRGALEAAGFRLLSHEARHVDPLPRWVGWTEWGEAVAA